MRRNLRTRLIAAAVCAALGVVLAAFPLGSMLVLFGYDLSFVFRPARPIHDCLIVEMDEKSYQELNQEWGHKWDRTLHAKLLEKLSHDQARLAVFDVVFLDATRDEADRQLANAIRDNGKVVLAAVSEPVNRQGIAGSEVRQPLQLLATNALGWGLADVERDTDLAVRRHYSGTERFPSLAWAAASVLQAPITKQPDERLKERWIDYYGPSHTIPALSYSDALAAPKGHFRDCMVFVGGHPKTQFVGDEVDEFSTPFTRWDGRVSGGVEVMATSTLNLVRGDWLTRLPLWLELLVVFMTGGVIGFMLCSLRPFKGFLVGTGIALTSCGLAIAIVWLWHAWFAWAVVAFAQVPLAWLISVAAQRFRPVSQGELELEREPAALQPSGLSAVMPISSVTSSNLVAAGAVIADYKLLRLIGEGGYGQVWLCKDAVGIYRATKVVYRTKFADEGPYQREFRGVQNFMRLNHPRLLRVLHIGPNVPQDLFYYVMELGDDERREPRIDPDKYEPRTLSRDLKRLGRLPVSECIALGLSIAEGLEYLHSQTLIHRDIKPSNIIYVEGVAKLADVGLVADPETTDLSLVGTRDYMDPHFPSSVAGDVYGLGKVLYVAMTGLSPGRFPNLPTDEALSPRQNEIDSLLRILTRACTADKVERYASVALMRGDLENVFKAIKC